MSNRRLVWSIAAFCCAFAMTFAWQRAGRLVIAAQAQSDTQPTDTVTPLWSTAITGYQASALSSDGTYAATLTSSRTGTSAQTISLWHEDSDKPLWTRPITEATQIVISAGGRYLLAYTPLDTLHRTISLLRGSDRALIGRSVLDGAIWTVTLSADGQSLGIVTGNRSLYLYTLGDHPLLHRWQLDGIGNSIDITPNSSYVAAGTWDDSGVSCYNLKGRTLWRYPEDAEMRRALLSRLFEAHIAQNGRYVLGVSYSNVRQGDGELYLWSGQGQGKPLWTYPLEADACFPKAQVTDNGYVVVTYLEIITRGEQSMPERRLLVLDNKGNPLWRKGGLLFSPTLVAIAPDGHRVTVSDGQRTLYDLNSELRITAKYACNGQIRQAIPSADGKLLLVYTGDGTLTLLKLG